MVAQNFPNSIAPSDPVSSERTRAYNREMIKLKESGVLQAGVDSLEDARQIFEQAAKARAINKRIDNRAEELVEAHQGRSLVFTPASQIPMKRVRWLAKLPGVLEIPQGELTLWAGREGTGKSQATLWLAAGVTRGELPGDRQGQPANVIVSSTEDSWEHTIAPRLWAAGADLDRVARVSVIRQDLGSQTYMTLPEDNAELEEAVKKNGVSLVILDPLLSAVSPRLNTYKAHEVRRALEPLSQIAHRTACTFAGLTHFSKADGKDVAHKMLDSVAFSAVTRAIVAFAMDGPDTGVMSETKNTLGRRPEQSLEYRICERQAVIEGECVGVAYFAPGNVTHRSVEDMLDSGEVRKTSQARDFLIGALMNGPRLSKEVEEAARQAGISERTLNRARSDLRVKSGKTADGWIIYT